MTRKQLPQSLESEQRTQTLAGEWCSEEGCAMTRVPHFWGFSSGLDVAHLAFWHWLVKARVEKPAVFLVSRSRKAKLGIFVEVRGGILAGKREGTEKGPSTCLPRSQAGSGGRKTAAQLPQMISIQTCPAAQRNTLCSSSLAKKAASCGEGEATHSRKVTITRDLPHPAFIAARCIPFQNDLTCEASRQWSTIPKEKKPKHS